VSPAIPETALALLHSILSLGTALGRVENCFSGVYVVVERGDGSKTHPYSGEVIECVSDSVPDAFRSAFTHAWWEARRPSFGPAVAVGRGGSGMPRGSSSGGAAAPGVGAESVVAVNGSDCSPTLSLHPTDVLLKAQSTDPGTRAVTTTMVTDVLRSLGLESINKITSARIKRIFNRISNAVTNPGKGRLQWMWPQARPIDLLIS